MNRRDLITKGMRMTGGACPGRMVIQSDLDEVRLDEVRQRLDLFQRKLDFIRGEDDETEKKTVEAEEDRLSWLMRHGYL